MPSRTEIISEFVPASPLVGHLGIRLEHVRGDEAELTLPGSDLTARARVLRRGRTLCFCENDVTDVQGALVAKGLMTHRYSEERSPSATGGAQPERWSGEHRTDRSRASTGAQPNNG